MLMASADKMCAGGLNKCPQNAPAQGGFEALARTLLYSLCMKKRATLEKKTRSLPHSVSAGQLSLPRLFLFLELFVGEIPDLSTK